MSREMGRVLAQGGHLNINGGGKSGCMGALNEGGIEAGGRIRGVIHEMWVVDGEEFDSFGSSGEAAENGEGSYELVLAGGPTLAERKELLAADADCFIALPGGPGTWEELWEIVCQRQLGLPPPVREGGRRGRGPVCLVNVDGFYDGFIATVERAMADGLLHWKSPGASSNSGKPLSPLDLQADVPQLLMHRPTAAEALDCCAAAVALERRLELDSSRSDGGSRGSSGAAAVARSEEGSPAAISAALPPMAPSSYRSDEGSVVKAGVVGAALGASLALLVRSRL